MGFRLVDAQSQQSFDMRSRQSVMFVADGNSTRKFLVQTSTSGTLPTIGNMSTTAGRLTGKVPATGTFGLNYDATVTATILDSQGHVVATLLNNQSLPKGNKTLAWDLKNQNGSYVAVGNYQFAVAATVDGNTARRTASIAVNR
jgi:flagellar basal-body rod modification protein FlgD